MGQGQRGVTSTGFDFGLDRTGQYLCEETGGWMSDVVFAKWIPFSMSMSNNLLNDNQENTQTGVKTLYR